MGLYGHPWLPIPSSGSDLRVTLPKIIIKKVKVKHSHSLPHLGEHYKSKGADLSSKIWRSQELLYTLLIRVILRDFRIISEIPLTRPVAPSSGF
jgi:hypothetical protein